MSIRLFTLAALGLVGAVLTANPALALRQYRCNGWVQYRPCDELQKPALVSTYRTPRKAPALVLPPPGDAKVIAPTFSRASEFGVWKGRVEGKGDIHLRLHILRAGQVEAVWYMGHVRLNGSSSSFKYVTVPPRGSNWSWVIVPTVT